MDDQRKNEVHLPAVGLQHSPALYVYVHIAVFLQIPDWPRDTAVATKWLFVFIDLGRPRICGRVCMELSYCAICSSQEAYSADCFLFLRKCFHPYIKSMF